MKIAFVNDAYEKLGVEYLSAVLKSYGHDVKLFFDPQLFYDENIRCDRLNLLFSHKLNLLKKLFDYKPDLVGFSVVSDFYLWACELARMIKEKYRNIPIIFGGIHSTSVPEHVIQNDFVDMICIGEGEYPLLELVESLESGSIDYSIRNVWFKRGGEIIRNPIRPLIQNLDELPLLDKELFYNESPHFKESYFALTGRGCLYACTYCCNSFLSELYKDGGKYFRKRSVSNIVNELRVNKKKYNIKLVRFHDDIFSADLDWLREFSLAYSKEVSVPFSCYMHPRILNEQIAKLLRDAGCYEAELGVQTISEKTREEVLRRFVSNSDIERAINILKNSGIKVTVNNIFGLPGQSIDEILDMARFYNNNRVTRLYFYGLRYYPKTKIIEIAKERGILNADDISRIEKGAECLTFVRGGHLLNDKELGKLRTLFTLLPWCSKRVNNFIIEKKIYRYFPIFPYFILVIFSNWLRISYRYNWMLRRTVQRYIIFITKKPSFHFY